MSNELWDQKVLETAERFLREEVGPRAQEIDRDPAAVKWALDGLCERNLMALRRPKEFGGPEISEDAFRQFQETCARYSGTLSFLQTQHQSACSMLAKSENEALKQEYLPKMGNGERLLGIGFSQLRRGGPPMITAVQTEGGYVIDGQVPWVTGYGFYPEFMIGATLPDGQALFGIVPLGLSEQAGGLTADLLSTPQPPSSKTNHFEEGGLTISQPMRLAAMEAANTVSVTLKSFFLDASKVVFIRPSSWIKNNDQINIALQGHFAIGCAQAGLDILLSAAEKRGLDFAQTAHDELSTELARCREETKRAQKGVDQEETTQDRLNVRAWAIDLAVRCAHAAVTASSGAANSINHPAQRVYREALTYTVSAQTTQIMEATLRRLVRP